VPRLGELRKDVPQRVVDVIHRALLPDPTKRFASARAMAHELSEALRQGESWGDADAIVGDAVSEARAARQQ
jgi:hypothetical protein